MNFNNMPLARKLWGTLVGLMLALLLLACALFYQLRQADAEAEQSVRFSEERIALALRWQGMKALSAERALVSALAADNLLSAQVQQRMAQGMDGAAALQRKMTEAAPGPEDQRLLARMGGEQEAVLQLGVQAQQARQAGDLELARTLVEQKLRPALAVHTASQNAFVQLQELGRAQAMAAAAERKATASWVAGGLAAVFFLAGLVLVGWLVRSITLPLKRAVGMADAMASGNLAVDAGDGRRDDELGHLLQSLAAVAARMRAMVGEVRSEMESVSGASEQMATDQKNLSAHTLTTAAGLKAAAVTLEQLNSTLSPSADTARQASQFAAHAEQTALHCGAVVEQAVSSMEHTAASARKMAHNLSAVEAIAFQANILALNAAMEATRAGDEGPGFAAVASEGRLLAKRSANAAKELKALIGTALHHAEAGAQQVAQAGQSLSDMAASVQHMGELVAGVTAASTRQHEGIAQASEVVSQLDQMAKQTIALDLQCGEAAKALHNKVQQLAQTMAVFNVEAGAAEDMPQDTAGVAAARFRMELHHHQQLGKAYILPATQAGAATAFACSTAEPLPTVASNAPRKQPVMASAEDWESF